MVFTSAVFLGVFLPLLIGVYFLANAKARPYVLLVFSLLFYAWGEPSAVFIMLALMVLNYFLALGMAAAGERKWLSAILLGVGVCADLGALVAYKYIGFIVSNLLPVFNHFGVKMEVPQVALPIGISFYVFQIISYMVDVRRGTVEAQRNPFKFMLYVSLFPQLIAGPIVRYATIAQDIENRTADFDNIVAGFRRFTIGLAKKVLIADVMAGAVDVIFAAKVETIPGFYCWLGAIMYTLQIYFDFSGYSDMAIGLGRVFNFRFLENFDHPYASCSVQEFWRRWHISLSSWFRDYLYIPLGGNRKGTVRTYVNLFVVFLLCGVWHGAAWKAGQTYTGGTEVSGSGTTLVAGTATHPFGNGGAAQTVTVGEGATVNLGTCVNGSTCVYNYNLGGSLICGYESGRATRRFNFVNVLSDSAALSVDHGLIGGTADTSMSRLQLNGHVLSISAENSASSHQPLIKYIAALDYGTVKFTNGYEQFYQNCDLANARVWFAGSSWIDLADYGFNAKDFRCDVAQWRVFGNGRSNNAQPKISGRYEAGANRPPLTLLSGATLDISEISGTWTSDGKALSDVNNNPLSTPGLVTLLSANASYTIDIGARNVSLGDKLVAFPAS